MHSCTSLSSCCVSSGNDVSRRREDVAWKPVWLDGKVGVALGGGGFAEVPYMDMHGFVRKQCTWGLVQISFRAQGPRLHVKVSNNAWFRTLLYSLRKQEQLLLADASPSEIIHQQMSISTIKKLKLDGIKGRQSRPSIKCGSE